MAHDNRNIEYPPRAREANDALSDYISARTVALIISRDGVMEIGTGTCVHLGVRWLLATAGHNLWDNCEIEIIPRDIHERFGISGRSHPPRVADGIDVGWIELDQATVERARLVFLEQHDLEYGWRSTAGRAFFVQGYPAAEVEILQHEPLVLDLLSMGVLVMSLDPGPDNTELILEYPPASPEDTGLELPHPRGISGGGVWIPPSFSESAIWAPSRTKLVAVVRAWERPRGRLLSVPIERWLALVAEDFPELVPVVDEVLSRPPRGIQTLISPRYSSDKLDDPSVEDLIDVLEDRIMFWLLAPAKTLTAQEHGMVASFGLVLPYFEGIWTYITGQDSRGRSRAFFKDGFVDVFRSSRLDPQLLARVADVLYEDARCGFAHDSFFRSRIYFGKVEGGCLHITVPRVNGVPDPTGEIQSIVVDVEEFFKYVEGHFGKLVARLRDVGQVEPRARFLEACRLKWDYEGDPRAIAL